MERVLKLLTMILVGSRFLDSAVANQQVFKKHANFKGNNVIQEIKTNSIIKCAAKCREHGSCSAFEFEETGGSKARCQLLGNLIVKEENGTNTLYWPANKDITPAYYFLSQNYPTYGTCAVVAYSYRSQIVNNCRENYTIISPGLSGSDGTVSIQSVKYPNRYWHASGMGQMVYFGDRSTAPDQTDFDEHASFILHINKWFEGYYTFESAKYSGYYIRHYGYIHQLHQLDNTDLFPRDASLKAVSNGHFIIT